MPRNYDSRAKHPGVESYFFFAALSDGGWCREEKNGRNKTGLLTYTILVDVEGGGSGRRDGLDQGGNDLWWSSSAGNRQLVSIPTGSFPPSAETVCLSENGCTDGVGAGRHQAELLNETRRRIEPRECHNYQGSPPSLPLFTLRWLSSSCREECVYIYIKRERERER